MDRGKKRERRRSEWVSKSSEKAGEQFQDYAKLSGTDPIANSFRGARGGVQRPNRLRRKSKKDGKGGGGAFPYLFGEHLPEDEGADEDVGVGDVRLEGGEVALVAELLEEVAHDLHGEAVLVLVDLRGGRLMDAWYWDSSTTYTTLKVARPFAFAGTIRRSSGFDDVNMPPPPPGPVWRRASSVAGAIMVGATGFRRKGRVTARIACCCCCFATCGPRNQDDWKAVAVARLEASARRVTPLICG